MFVLFCVFLFKRFAYPAGPVSCIWVFLSYLTGACLVCSLCVLSVFFECSLCVLCVSFECSLCVLYVFFECSLCVVCVFFVCSLIVFHCLLLFSIVFYCFLLFSIVLYNFLLVSYCFLSFSNVYYCFLFFLLFFMALREKVWAFDRILEFRFWAPSLLWLILYWKSNDLETFGAPEGSPPRGASLRY